MGETSGIRGKPTKSREPLEPADGGTIFLDEIAETTPAFQVKLLRVLQEGSITPLGSPEEIKVDVRVIAATNRNVRDVNSSSLRKDLYYRLMGCEIFLPPLKDRPEDIIPLASHFALQAARKVRKKVWFSVKSFVATTKVRSSLVEQSLPTVTLLNVYRLKWWRFNKRARVGG